MWGEIKAQLANEWIDLEWASTNFYAPGHRQKWRDFQGFQQSDLRVGNLRSPKKLHCKISAAAQLPLVS